MFYIRIQLIIILFFSSLNGYSENVIINSDFSSAYLNNYFECFEDTTGLIDISSINKCQFLKNPDCKFNFGYSKSTYWFKTKIENKTENDRLIVLVNKNHYLDNCDVYYISDSNIIHNKIGAESYSNLSVIPFIIKSKKNDEIYIKISSKTPLRISFRLFNKNKTIRSNRINNLFTGSIFGAIISISLLSLFVSFFLKEKLYLLFGLFILSFSIYLSGYEELLPKIEIFGQSNFLLKASVAFVPVSQFLYIYFSKQFFDFKSTNRLSLFIINGLLITSSIHLLVFFFSYRIGLTIIYIFAPIASVCIIIFTIYSWILTKKKYFKIYSLATCLFILGVFIQIAIDLGIIHNYILSIYALKSGFLALIVIFVYSLIDRTVLISKNFTSLLNEKVEERTDELEQTLFKLKTRRQQLIQSEKMASIGILTSGLAHELLNPINFINGGIEIIKIEHKKNDSTSKNAMEALEYIESGMNKATEIVTSILEFSYSSKQPKVGVKIEEIIDRTLLVLKPKIKPEIRLKKEYYFNKEIYVYKAKIHQVFVSILNNAIFYSLQSNEKSPEIIISTIEHYTYLEIRISNNGPSIPQTDLTTIFNPFYSTKEVGTGTGLGLSTALSIIQSHNGSIEAINLTKGACFIIKLPFES